MSEARKTRILVADDDQSIRQLVCTILKREHYTADCVGDGVEAIEHLEKHDYAVVLLDLMMPHEGGITVIRHLQAKNPTSLARVLVLTASAESAIGPIRDAVAGVIQKPFEKRDLIDAVRQIADRP